MKNKFVCVHGHFYQPPRENPWLDAVEPEASAHPYRDWNTRIFEECYGPNAACPLAGPDGRLVGMADNFALMSFDFGPTLLSWLESERPSFYRALLACDEASVREREHGNAVAHPYIHAILPLQTPRDKRTLVRWGLEDFQARFRRPAEGFWLPETAVDDETLEVLVEQGLRYTILSPLQAARLREVGSGEEGWKDVNPVKLQPTRPYRWLSKAQPGKSLAVFFYHEKLSRGVVSGETIESGEAFFRKIHARFLPEDSTQLVSVASDGEFYGHHHRHGAAALAEAFARLSAAGIAAVNYGQFLDIVPPPQEVEIAQRTAWSCEHGLGRWTRDCGCRVGPEGTSQGWREPLRQALDELSTRLDDVYERNAGRFLQDFREAREGYALRLSDFSDGAGARYFESRARLPLDRDEAVDALRLLELERHRLSMFTSCGWFFDDVAGLEAAQCLAHAGRAAELARPYCGEDLEAALLARLEQVPCNAAELKTGRGVYEKLVKPRACDLARAAAHFALCVHVEGAWPSSYGFAVESSRAQRRDKQGLAGRDRSLSMLSLELMRRATQERLSADVLVYQRDRVDFSCWVLSPGQADFEPLSARFTALDDEPFLAAARRKLGPPTHSLEAMLQQERREALKLLLPGPGDSPARKRFLERWREALRRLASGEREDEVLDLLKEAAPLGLKVQQLPWSFRLSDELMRVLEDILERRDAAALSRAARWLEACETSGAPVSLWRLRFFYWRWRKLLQERGGLPPERDAAVALGEKLGFADAALPLGAVG